MRWLYTANCRYTGYSYINFRQVPAMEFVSDTECREMQEDDNETDTTDS